MAASWISTLEERGARVDVELSKACTHFLTDVDNMADRDCNVAKKFQTTLVTPFWLNDALLLSKLFKPIDVLHIPQPPRTGTKKPLVDVVDGVAVPKRVAVTGFKLRER
jgi:hypothetical protein